MEEKLPPPPDSRDLGPMLAFCRRPVGWLLALIMTVSCPNRLLWIRLDFSKQVMGRTPCGRESYCQTATGNFVSGHLEVIVLLETTVP
ncbi:hypothetical protein INR49_021089 [Caranx melampygus]|nr:hypothetical protein INR49_021089 [Caranx melampygus]